MALYALGDLHLGFQVRKPMEVFGKVWKHHERKIEKYVSQIVSPRELGTTILMTEHRLEEVFPAADKAGVMEEGKMLLWDVPRTVGKRLREIRENHKMLVGLPSAVRIYNALDVPRHYCCDTAYRKS